MRDYEIGYEEIGAVATAKGPVTLVRALPTGAPSRMASLQRPPIVPQIPATRSGLASTRTALPLGQHVFANGGAVAAQLQQTAQGFMRSRKLVLTRHNVGVASPGLAVTVTNVRFGAQSVLIGVGGMPVEMFGADAVDNEIVAGVPVSPGLLVTIDLAIDAAPAAGETVTIGGALLGDSV